MSSGGMSLDIRIPIGLLFTILGLIVGGYGMVSGDKIYAKSLNINVNIYSGLGMVIFGVLMLLLAWIGRKGKNAAPAATPPAGAMTDKK